MLTEQDIEKLKAVFATKKDFAQFATKDDLKNFATKDDLKNFAAKDDLLQLEQRLNAKCATKADLLDFKIEILNEIRIMQDELAIVIGYRDDIEDHEIRITKLEKGKDDLKKGIN